MTTTFGSGTSTPHTAVSVLRAHASRAVGPLRPVCSYDAAAAACAAELAAAVVAASSWFELRASVSAAPALAAVLLRAAGRSVRTEAATGATVTTSAAVRDTVDRCVRWCHSWGVDPFEVSRRAAADLAAGDARFRRAGAAFVAAAAALP